MSSELIVFDVGSICTTSVSTTQSKRAWRKFICRSHMNWKVYGKSMPLLTDGLSYIELHAVLLGSRYSSAYSNVSDTCYVGHDVI